MHRHPDTPVWPLKTLSPLCVAPPRARPARTRCAAAHPKATGHNRGPGGKDARAGHGRFGPWRLPGDARRCNCHFSELGSIPGPSPSHTLRRAQVRRGAPQRPGGPAGSVPTHLTSRAGSGRPGPRMLAERILHRIGPCKSVKTRPRCPGDPGPVHTGRIKVVFGGDKVHVPMKFRGHPGAGCSDPVPGAVWLRCLGSLHVRRGTPGGTGHRGAMNPQVDVDGPWGVPR